MTPYSIERLDFTDAAISRWARHDARHSNWPVVYVIDGDRRGDGGAVYVGETVNAAARMRQHRGSSSKDGLRSVRVVIDDTFNKSVCLDLESHLIRWLAGDGKFTVLNGNEGIIDAQYYAREMYRESFRDIFDTLRSEGLFERSIPEIENSDLFKLSPFKVLTQDQAIAVEDIVEGLLEDLKSAVQSESVIRGNPGTGKTIVAIFLMKLLADIRDHDDTDEVEPDSMFSEFFVPESRALLEGLRIGLVVPQQSLRESIKRVFKKIPKLSEDMILTPFDVGKSDEPYDILIVDETHRLNQRANQSSGMRNRDFVQINERLFGEDDRALTQLDWIRAQSSHRIFLVDEFQTVRPADLSADVLSDLVEDSKRRHRHYALSTQMRVKADADYVDFIRGVLRGEPPRIGLPDFGEYDLRLYANLRDMAGAIQDKNRELGLARLVAGYAWEWKSRRNPDEYDIELDGLRLRWNSTDKDWINSAKSVDEVGSIHTVQGYDLNYAGVIIGPDLRYDSVSDRLFIDRDSYRDKKGKEHLTQLGMRTTDDDLLEFIRNIYGVLLTRGVRGTYIYACDPGLRQYLAAAFGGFTT